MLRTVNSVMLRDCAEEELCTAIYGRLETDGERDGPPLDRRPPAAGAAAGRRHRRPAGVTGTLLGVHDDPSLNDTDIELGPGDALVMVTDGVQDSRMPDGRLGEKRLVELVRRLPRADARAEIAARIEEAVAAAPVIGPGDDVAVLVVRALPR